jgi:hypothetical protein
MGSYSNPHVSSEPGFLKLMASLGGDSIPQSGLREAAVAYYGQLPTKFTGLVLFRFKDEVAAESAAHAVASKSKFESRIYRTDVFRKGTVVAMSWERRDAEATCLTPILRHYEEGAFAKTDR